MDKDKISPKKIIAKVAEQVKNPLGVASKTPSAPVKGLDILIMLVIGLIFFVTPLFFTNLASQGLGFEKMVVFYFLVLLGTVAWVTKGVIVGELEFKRTPLDWPIIITLIIFTAATLFSVSVKDSLIGFYGTPTKGLVAIVSFVLFFYLMINNISLGRIKFLLWSFLASSSLIIVYSLLQLNDIYLLPLAFTHTASFNPLGSLSGLTMFLIISLPLLVVATAQIREIHPKIPGAVALAVKIILGAVSLAGLAILALLNGFTFWPAAIVGVVIVLMFFLSKIIRISSGNLAIPIITFLLLIILLVLGNFNLLNLNLPAEVSLSRGASWDIAKAGLAENPVLGSGPATYYYSFNQFKSSDFNASPLWNVRFNSPSGLLFEMLNTVGALGSLAAAVVILIALSICFLALIKGNQKELQSVLLALFASFISLIIIALLFTLNNSLLVVFMMIALLTVAVAIIGYPERFKSVKLSFRASAKYALALAAIFLCVSAGVVILFTLGLKMYLGDYYAKRAIDSADNQQKITELTKAIQLAPYQDSYYLVLANSYMALANQEALGNRNQTVIETNLNLAIDNGKRAVAIAPSKADNNEQLALIYENASFYVRGALEWAEDYYNKVMELDPHNPTPDLRIALLNMARANLETEQSEKEYYINEAIKKYDQANAKKDDLAAAHYGKAIAYEQLGNDDQAIEELKRASLLARNNLDYRFELGRLYFNRGVKPPAGLSQTASEDITTGQGEGDELSVTPSPSLSGTISRNDDLNLAEQLLLSILQAAPNHANSLYSLALLYQKVGEEENAGLLVAKLLEVLESAEQKELVKQQFPGLY